MTMKDTLTKENSMVGAPANEDAALKENGTAEEEKGAGRYTIREAAQLVNVETHVLRYWEEELGLSIGRNELGHRFYTEADVELLEKVRNWKQQGLQLKAIRLMLSGDGKLSVPQEVVRQAQALVEKEAGLNMEETGLNAEEEGARMAAMQEKTGLSVENILLDERSSKAAKLQLLLENLVSRAVQENNEAILKELDFQFRQFEENARVREEKRMEREEEHYRKLDELLCQRGRRKDIRKRHPKQKF